MCFELLMCTLPICRSVLCVLKVKGMSVRVTLMLSLMSEKPTSIFILTYLMMLQPAGSMSSIWSDHKFSKLTFRPQFSKLTILPQWVQSFLIVVYEGILGVLDDGVSFISGIVMISSCVSYFSCFSYASALPL